MRYPNIYSLFRDRIEHYSKRDGEGDGGDVFYFRQEERWQGVSWNRFDTEAHAFGYALLASGLTLGASVCVLMSNVPEWPINDIGTISAGGVGVGLYPTSSAEQCEYIINHSDAEFVLVDTRFQLDKILSILEKLPMVKAVIALDEEAARSAQGVLSYKEFLQIGRDNRERVSSLLKERAEGAQADDTAIMVYTSGTTGFRRARALAIATSSTA